ncbi:MAG: hypothetical protein JWO73_633, partial [Candidatus Taylorbacteria bacterium]|nr:hypothetical protein [Candidatus Taylorbacteria bacterium]
PTGEYNNLNHATLASGSGTFYLHVQAKDMSGNESAVKTVSVTITPNTGGTGTTTNPGGTGTTTPPTDNNNGGNGTTTNQTGRATVTANPSSGWLQTGDVLSVHIQAGGNDSNWALNGACTINNRDVSGTFHNDGAGSYSLAYTVGANDIHRSPGLVPIYCSFRNSTTNQTALIAEFTDRNSVAVGPHLAWNAEAAGTSTPSIINMTAQPSFGTLNVGDLLAVYFEAANGQNDLVLGGSCTINGKDVSSTFQNLTDGFYKLIYTVAHGDESRSAGSLPASCTLRSPSGEAVTANAFTDSNTIAVDGTGTSTPAGGTGNPTGTSTDSTGGDLTGTTGGSTATTSLAVNSITSVRDIAAADGTFEHGWKWIFNITVPANETQLSMKFNDWMISASSTNTSSSVPVASNVRISSAQASSADAIILQSAGQYSAPLTLNADMDSAAAGRQVQVIVEVKIPQGTPDATYTTSFGVRTQ